jgi:hypothetical protein
MQPLFGRGWMRRKWLISLGQRSVCGISICPVIATDGAFIRRRSLSMAHLFNLTSLRCFPETRLHMKTSRGRATS